MPIKFIACSPSMSFFFLCWSSQHPYLQYTTEKCKKHNTIPKQSLTLLKTVHCVHFIKSEFAVATFTVEGVVQGVPFSIYLFQMSLLLQPLIFQPML